MPNRVTNQIPLHRHSSPSTGVRSPVVTVRMCVEKLIVTVTIANEPPPFRVASFVGGPQDYLGRPTDFSSFFPLLPKATNWRGSYQLKLHFEIFFLIFKNLKRFSQDLSRGIKNMFDMFLRNKSIKFQSLFYQSYMAYMGNHQKLN